MDDIIVLILTLIFIVAGIFGQMKKRQLPEDEQNQAKPERHNFWETLEDEKEEPMGVTEHLVPAEEVAKEDRFHTSGSMMRREFTTDVTKQMQRKTPVASAAVKKFPLKKAVIYSEILNRKYF